MVAELSDNKGHIENEDEGRKRAKWFSSSF